MSNILKKQREYAIALYPNQHFYDNVNPVCLIMTTYLVVPEIYQYKLIVSTRSFYKMVVI